jgi:hypothetical protein
MCFDPTLEYLDYVYGWETTVFFPAQPLFGHTLIEWTWTSLGFGVGRINDLPDGKKITLWAIPYWSIVIPVTLLSAWLLLSKLKKVSASNIDAAETAI